MCAICAHDRPRAMTDMMHIYMYIYKYLCVDTGLLETIANVWTYSFIPIFHERIAECILVQRRASFYSVGEGVCVYVVVVHSIHVKYDHTHIIFVSGGDSHLNCLLT